MSRLSLLPPTLLAVLALPALTFAQPEVSPPALPPVPGAAGQGSPANSPPLAATQSSQPIEIFRSGMQRILVRRDSANLVNNAISASVVIVDAQGRSYTLAIQGKDGADNLEAALLFAEQLRNSKKIVVHKHRTIQGMGTLIDSFTLHVFDNR